MKDYNNLEAIQNELELVLEDYDTVIKDICRTLRRQSTGITEACLHLGHMSLCKNELAHFYRIISALHFDLESGKYEKAFQKLIQLKDYCIKSDDKLHVFSKVTWTNLQNYPHAMVAYNKEVYAGIDNTKEYTYRTRVNRITNGINDIFSIIDNNYEDIRNDYYLITELI